MTEFETRFEANVAQAEYWNAKAGPKWVRNDDAMDARLRPLADGLLSRISLAGGESVLDVGCGSGATTGLIGSAVGDDGTVLGIDISEPLLENARRRCAGLANVSFENADAQVHDLSSGRFDILASRLGVMFFADPYAAFENLGRSLRPDGRVHLVCWASMDQNPWLTLAMEVAKPYLGPLEPPPPRSPGAFGFSDPEYVTDILTKTGFREIDIDPSPVSIASSDPAEVQAELYLQVTPAATLIAATNPTESTVAAIERDVAAELRNHERDGTISLDACVIYVSASR